LDDSGTPGVLAKQLTEEASLQQYIKIYTTVEIISDIFYFGHIDVIAAVTASCITSAT